MFNFLNEEKRQVLFNHPVLRKLNIFPDNYKEFLRNLELFGPDLCSKQDSRGANKQPYQVFTEEDIKQIREYTQSILKGVFGRIYPLATRILNEAGFDVFVHGGYRADLNDWINNPDFYTRGIHNLREILYAKYFVDRKCYNFVVPIEGIFTKKVEETYRIKPSLPKGAAIGKIVNPHGVKFHDGDLNFWFEPYVKAA